jgi:hypothetical protein
MYFGLGKILVFLDKFDRLDFLCRISRVQVLASTMHNDFIKTNDD